MPSLIKPNLKYENDYFKAAADLVKEVPYYAKSYPLGDLAGQIKRWEELEEAGQAYRFWLVDGKKYLGTLLLRRDPLSPEGQVHYSINPAERNKGYGTLILKLGLEKARELNFASVIITCKETNIASRKIIEANGGLFLDKEQKMGEAEELTILRYQIKL